MSEDKHPPTSDPTLKLAFEAVSIRPTPNFEKLLREPLVTTPPLPRSFLVEVESAHLRDLWSRCPQLQDYQFLAFVYAGGSGMVFKVQRNDSVEALKIARKHLFKNSGLPDNAADSLSPVSERELAVLRELFHPNVVRLLSTITFENKLIAIGTTYIDQPLNLDEYLRYILEQTPTRGLHAFSPERLENACIFLIHRAQEIASALTHMHEKGIYHFDLKPANILISQTTRTAVLTDMGSCVDIREHKPGEDIRVHFTWTYAHPTLQEIIHNPGSISGGGLKASASVPNENLAKYDLYAFGKTLQQALAVLDDIFEERCYASYSFRFLHLVSCLLLDGRNAPATVPDPRKRTSRRDGLDFVSDAALQYPVRVFELHKIISAGELEDRLKRHSRDYSWSATVPELDPWQAQFINTGIDRNAPFTKRVAVIFNHPAMRRLKSEAQLGWMREVYTSATHTRWSHALGTFDSLTLMYSSLLADPEVPTFRVLIDIGDIEHGMVAAILHDIGQTGFGHDFESVSTFSRHEAYAIALLKEDVWGVTLEQTIKQYWPNVDLDRVLDILRVSRKDSTAKRERRPIDGVTADAINGPIDADKLDYLLRDTINCGVPYGLGMDKDRLVLALTVSVAPVSGGGCRMSVAYKAKGRPAVESMLIARYQMYMAVYWHHAFRNIVAMFGYAVASTFDEKKDKDKYRKVTFTKKQLQELFYFRIVCRQEWAKVFSRVFKEPEIPAIFTEQAPPAIAAESAIEFVWRFAEDRVRGLLGRLATRSLYKRVFDFHLGELGETAEYSKMQNEVLGIRRVVHADKIRKFLTDKIYQRMQERVGPKTTTSESAARIKLQELAAVDIPLIVVDFPTRGLPEETNIPVEISDPNRKYFSIPPQSRTQSFGVFHDIRRLQTRNAALRVFAAPELHELVVRYLNAEDVRACVGESITMLQIAD
jgi:HD superfamily phosphohydrolase